MAEVHSYATCRRARQSIVGGASVYELNELAVACALWLWMWTEDTNLLYGGAHREVISKASVWLAGEICIVSWL